MDINCINLIYLVYFSLKRNIGFMFGLVDIYTYTSLFVLLTFLRVHYCVVQHRLLLKPLDGHQLITRISSAT